MTSGDAYRVGVVPAEETRKSAPSILDALLFNIHCVYLLVGSCRGRRVLRATDRSNLCRTPLSDTKAA